MWIINLILFMQWLGNSSNCSWYPTLGHDPRTMSFSGVICFLQWRTSMLCSMGSSSLRYRWKQTNKNKESNIHPCVMPLILYFLIYLIIIWSEINYFWHGTILLSNIPINYLYRFLTLKEILTVRFYVCINSQRSILNIDLYSLV